MSTTLQRRYYSVAELNQLTGIPLTSLYRGIRQNEIRHVRIGGAIRVPVDELDRIEQGGGRE